MMVALSRPLNSEWNKLRKVKSLLKKEMTTNRDLVTNYLPDSLYYIILKDKINKCNT